MRKLRNAIRLVTISCLSPFFKRLTAGSRRVWLFGAWSGLSYTDNPRYLFEYVESNMPDVFPVWVCRTKELCRQLRASGHAAVVGGGWKSAFLGRAAEAVFYCITRENDLPSTFFESRVINVQLWHGMPMKKIGIEQGYKSAVSPSYIISSGPIHSKILSEAFREPREKILELGLPRNDLFFCKATESRTAAVLGLPQNTKLVLYMPTYRDSIESNTPNPVEQMRSHRRLNELLEEHDAYFLIKGHELDRRLDGTALAAGRFRGVKKEHLLDPQDLLRDAWLLITDYSSCYFDFLLTQKPSILFQYDSEIYASRSRAMYFPPSEYASGDVVGTLDELTRALEKYFRDPEQDRDRRAQMLRKFHSYQDGKASERIARHIHSARGVSRPLS